MPSMRGWIGSCLLGWWSVASATCNYVYPSNTGTTYALGVCMVYDQKNYVQYECGTNSDSEQTVLAKYYNDDNTCSNAAKLANTIDLVSMSESYNWTLEYECGGYDDCYVEYKRDCDDADNAILVYAPLNTCVTDFNTSVNYQFDCDGTQLLYYEYDTSDTLCENTATNTQTITDCANVASVGQYWEYSSCNLAPTQSPTRTPSQSPSIAPTQSPITPYPTVDIPCWNLTIQQCLDQMGNASPPSHHYGYAVALTLATVLCVLLFR